MQIPKNIMNKILLLLMSIIMLEGLIGLASAQATSLTTSTIHYYILNPQGTAVGGNFLNSSGSFDGLLQYEGANLCLSLGGATICNILGFGLLLVIFLIITLTISFSADFMIGVMVGAFISDGIGLLFMQLGILSANNYFIFIGLSIGSVILFMVRGALRPY